MRQEKSFFGKENKTIKREDEKMKWRMKRLFRLEGKRKWPRIRLAQIQKRCKHDDFEYDSDMNVTYCNRCGDSIFCVDLNEEIMSDVCFDNDYDPEFDGGY